jgi:ribosomal protein S18 acetylase RimI-like enzyme
VAVGRRVPWPDGIEARSGAVVVRDGRERELGGALRTARDRLASFGEVDGHAVFVREATDGDAAAVERLVAASAGAPAGAPQLHLGRDGSVTLVAQAASRIVAVAQYRPIAGSPHASVVVAVAPVSERSELAVYLVDQLANHAFARGVERFVSDLGAANASVLAVFVRAGFATEISVGDGVMHMSFSVDPARRDAGHPTVRAVPVWQSPIGGSPRA